MRLDSHQHFWRYNDRDFGWMTESMGKLRKDYLPEALEPLLTGIGFDGTVVVQARRMTEETEWLLELSNQSAFIKGVVGWVDFESHRLDELLEQFASNAKFKGVRDLIHDQEDLNYAISDAHMRGVSKLASFDLAYDLLLKPQHIRPAIELVHKLPDQRFVVDHLAKPDIARQMLLPWSKDITTLARYDNVCCKLSGLVTEAKWTKWLPKDFTPYLDIVLEAFGSERLMIGSDWPVCSLSGDYEDVMSVVIDYASQLSQEEREDILGESCAKFYGIVEPSDSAS